MEKEPTNEIAINNPLKIILKKDYDTLHEVIRNYITILTISSGIKLTELETETLAHFIELGEVTDDTKESVVKLADTSMQTINNQISKFKKLGIVSKTNELHKEFLRKFTNPTLIYIKYGVNHQESGEHELPAIQTVEKAV